MLLEHSDSSLRAPAYGGWVLTFGHGRLAQEELGALVTGAAIELAVDVRRFPGSRANPAASRGAVPDLLEGLGVGYRWEERLGGRRHLNADEDAASPDRWWQVAAFRAYAAWTRSPDFRSALPQLLADDEQRLTAIMCSESVWWRCHRRVIADVLTLEFGRLVDHLMPDGRLIRHEPSQGARIGPDGHLVWDGQEQGQTARPRSLR